MQDPTKPAASAPDVSPNANGAGVPSNGATAAPDGEEWRNPAEIKKALKLTRDTAKRFESLESKFDQVLAALANGQRAPGSPSGAPPSEGDDDGDTPLAKGKRIRNADVMERVTQVEAMLAFKEALVELDKPLSKEQRKVLERLYKAERPDPEQLADWMADNLQAFGASSPVPQRAQESAAAPRNPPLPVAPDQSIIPTDIFQISGPVARSLDHATRKEKYQQFLSARGDVRNPFAAPKGSKP